MARPTQAAKKQDPPSHNGILQGVPKDEHGFCIITVPQLDEATPDLPAMRLLLQAAVLNVQIAESRVATSIEPVDRRRRIKAMQEHKAVLKRARTLMRRAEKVDADG